MYLWYLCPYIRKSECHSEHLSILDALEIPTNNEGEKHPSPKKLHSLATNNYPTILKVVTLFTFSLFLKLFI